MLKPFTAFERLNAEWPSVCRSRQAAAALARWSDDPALAGALTLDELLDRRIGCPPAAADRLLRALAARCADDPVALRTLLQALMPGLVRLACRTRCGGEDVAGELVSLAWCRLATGAYHHRPGSVAANVLLDVRKYYMRQHRRRAPAAIGDPGEDSQGERARGRLATVPLPDDIGDQPLVRHGAAFAASRGTVPAPEEEVDDRDTVVRLLGRAQVPALTKAILWGRLCGLDNDALRSRFGLTRSQPWDHWRRGLAAITPHVEDRRVDRAA